MSGEHLTGYGEYTPVTIKGDASAAPTGPEPSQVEPPSGVSPLRASVSSAWPSDCIRPGTCSRHGGCMYAMSKRTCRHYGDDLAADIERARDRRAEREDAQRPRPEAASPIDEVEAPDLKALQAENERLKADAEGWRSLWFEANRATSAWAYQACKDKISLAESERKRVETETILHRLCAATNDQGWTPVGYAECVAKISRDARALLSTTPTQETPNVAG